MSDKGIVIKITDFGIICELADSQSSDANQRLHQHMADWIARGTENHESPPWLFVNQPVEIIDCRILTKPR